jgi:Galactose oxidase, central domain/F-box-like
VAVQDDFRTFSDNLSTSLTGSNALPIGSLSDDDDDDVDDGAGVRRPPSSPERHIMWVHGGYEGRLGMASAELYCCHLATFQWLHVETTPKRRPSARYQHSGLFFAGSLYVFGGRNEDNVVFDDLWRFDCSKLRWHKIKPKHSAPWPTPRFGHGAVVDWGSGHHMVLVGGRPNSDVWQFDFATQSWDRQDVLIDATVALSTPSVSTILCVNTATGSMWDCFERGNVGGLNAIPQEVALQIFERFVDREREGVSVRKAEARSLFMAAAVCRRWRETLLSKEAEERVWRTLYASLCTDQFDLYGLKFRPFSPELKSIMASDERLMQKIQLFEDARQRHAPQGSGGALYSRDDLWDLASAIKLSSSYRNVKIVTGAPLFMLGCGGC